MKDVYYVIFNKNGVDRCVKTNGFQLKSGEFVQRVNFVVDDALFQKVTIPEVTLQVGQSGVARFVDVSVIDKEREDVG